MLLIGFYDNEGDRDIYLVNFVWDMCLLSFDTMLCLFSRNWNREPNNYMGKEDCGLITSLGQYNDMSCFNHASAICELKHIEYRKQAIFVLLFVCF